MKRVPRPLILAALTAALVLHGVSCNRVGNSNKASDAIIAITGITYDGQSVAATTKDVTASILFDVVARNNSTVFPGDPHLNAVSFTLGSTNNKIILTILSEPAKVAAGAGAVVNVFAHFDGEDLLGRPVDLDTALGTSITP